jgi:hypothetical protein
MQEVITPEMAQIKMMISETYAKRENLKTQMQEWYDRFPNQHYSKIKDLLLLDSTLSKLDTHYKQLWDYNNKYGASNEQKRA